MLFEEKAGLVEFASCDIKPPIWPIASVNLISLNAEFGMQAHNQLSQGGTSWTQHTTAHRGQYKNGSRLLFRSNTSKRTKAQLA